MVTGWDGNFSFNQNIGNVSLTIRANATYSDNEILEKDEGHKLYPYLYETGFSVSQSRGLIALGLFKDWDDIRNSPTQNTWGSVEPGDIKYKDVNGDGVINNNDRVAVGNTNRPRGLTQVSISKEPVNLLSSSTVYWCILSAAELGEMYLRMLSIQAAGFQEIFRATRQPKIRMPYIRDLNLEEKIM